MRGIIRLLCALSLLIGTALPAAAEDGHDLWLRYRALPAPAAISVARRVGLIRVEETDPRIVSAAGELRRALAALIGARTGDGRGVVLLGTPRGSPAIRELHLDLSRLGDEGYRLRTTTISGRPAIVVAANGGAGVLYGTFALIRRLQLGQPLDGLDVADAPRTMVRVLDHWDNLDRFVERGYAGQSIWDWATLPEYRDPLYTDYARANASIGINGAVLDNVNAPPEILTAPYIAKAAVLADMLRPWGMKVYLSVRFSSPVEIGGLKTADPLDPAVRAWWRTKADEIYRVIPDFGGFLVKANSEGQPGPRDYGRSQAEGANVLAAALAPHRGIVMWRTFVYGQAGADDRAKQAYAEFKPLDGRFADNVLLQVKNGPLDFQPREPFHPLFGAMPRTALMPEFQITKEYLGFASHLVYLGPLFEETLRSDTGAVGPGSTVAKVIDGSLGGGRPTGMAGVANIGSDRDWSGSTFNQANWYAFGRLAWNPDASSRAIAEEWAGLTFTPDPRFTGPVVTMMMRSRQAAVDYMTPLGLAHLMGSGHHYGPAPWVADQPRPEWNPVYYHRADADGIGFDRTATGSNAIAQYAPVIAARFADPKTTGDDYLLWFHHLPWGYRMADGSTLWDSLVHRYDRGVDEVAAMQAQWAALAPYVDSERFARTSALLAIQRREAQWWRDACVSYFQSINHLPLPVGAPPPALPLAEYEAMRFPYAPGQPR